jgi:hypothetical protein
MTPTTTPPRVLGDSAALGYAKRYARELDRLYWRVHSLADAVSAPTARSWRKQVGKHLRAIKSPWMDPEDAKLNDGAYWVYSYALEGGVLVGRIIKYEGLSRKTYLTRLHITMHAFQRLIQTHRTLDRAELKSWLDRLTVEVLDIYGQGVLPRQSLNLVIDGADHVFDVVSDRQVVLKTVIGEAALGGKRAQMRRMLETAKAKGAIGLAKTTSGKVLAYA